MDILQKGVDAGLVLQPGNSQKASNICMCCGCCCQVLKQLKSIPEPAKVINSSYYAVVDKDKCSGCGTCQERCHIDAIELEETAGVDIKRCIGCGACVPSCDAEAIALKTKEENKRWVPPKSTFETYLNIAKERGLI